MIPASTPVHHARSTGDTKGVVRYSEPGNLINLDRLNRG